MRFRWKVRQQADPWNLDAAVFSLAPGHELTARDLMEDVIAFGGKGSGKTSCLALLLKALLERGWGVMALTAKTEEVGHLLRLCERTGRGKDVRLIGPGHPGSSINALNYEWHQSGHVENLVQLMLRFMEISERKGGGHNAENGFFRRAAQELLRHGLTVVIAATGGVSLQMLQNVITSAPTVPWLTWPDAELTPEQKPVAAGWKETSAFGAAFRLANARRRDMSVAEEADLDFAWRYFTEAWPTLAPETRTGVSATVSGITDLCSRSPLREMLCGDTNLRPESVWEQGLILIQDAPIHRYGEVGLFQQAAWKFVFQKAAMRRDTGACRRPVVLWEDEYQETAAPELDQQFSCVSRSTLTATIRITQSASNLHALSHNRAVIDSLIGNNGNRLFFKCDDVNTMQYGQELGGRVLRRFYSTSVQPQPFDPMDLFWGANSTCSSTVSEHFEYALPAPEFASLRRGGPHGYAECIAFLSAGDGSRERPRWLKCRLPQWFSSSFNRGASPCLRDRNSL